MKYGAQFAELTGIRYDQTNNIIERIFADQKKAGRMPYWLESCNVESICCCVEAVGADFIYQLPMAGGRPVFGQGDFMTFFAYSTYARERMPVIVEGQMENEFAENLVWLAQELAEVNATLHMVPDGKSLVAKMKECLKRGSAVALSYLTDYGSGHYVAIVQYDDAGGYFRGYDSWAANKHCKRGGVLEEYPDSFFIARGRPRCIEISREE